MLTSVFKLRWVILLLCYCYCCWCVFLSSGVPGDMIHEYPKIRHEFTQSFKHPYYLSDNTTIPHFERFGDVESSPHAVRLTPSQSNKRGAVWATRPNNLTSWSVVVTLQIVGDQKAVGGDGLALWYTAERGQLGPIFGNRDSWTGLGIFLDTFDNDGKKDNPAIQAVYNTGNYNYNWQADGEGHVFAHCFKEVRNTYFPILLRLVYTNRTLTLDIDTEGHGLEYEQCFQYSPIHLTSHYYFGLSAQTSHFADAHDIVSFDVYDLDPSPKPKVQSSSSGSNPSMVEDATILKKHEQIQNKLHDMIHQKESDSFEHVDTQSQTANLQYLKTLVIRMEEKQQKMKELMEEYFNRPTSSSSDNSNSLSMLSKMVEKMDGLDRQVKGCFENIQLLSQAMHQLVGTHSGSQSVMHQVAQLNQLTHTKLASIEETSKKSHERADQLHQVLEEKDRSYFYYYIGLIIIQILLLLIFLFVRRPSNPLSSLSSFQDKKFI